VLRFRSVDAVGLWRITGKVMRKESGNTRWKSRCIETFMATVSTKTCLGPERNM